MSTDLLVSPPVESRLRRLGRRLSFWWKSETTAADVKKAFQAAAKAHEKYSNNACSTHRLMREWSSQLASPSFAPEIGNATLQSFMIEMCSAVKPDATQTREFNELLAGVADTFESLSYDEANCKEYLHELMAAKKSADKHRSNNEDSGLAEKNCEHWNQRLSESARILGDKRDSKLRANINQLLKHLQIVEPLLARTAVDIDAAHRDFSKVSAINASHEHASVSPPLLGSSFYHKPDEADMSPSAYPQGYLPGREIAQQDESSVYTGGSFASRSGQNKWHR